MTASWGHGYPVSRTYSTTFQPSLSPDCIDLSLLARSYLPPRQALALGPWQAQFRYLELGCGTGGTLCAMAAANPEGRFVGIDYMPEHVAEARRLAQEAGLENVSFIEASFGALLEYPGLDPFDYIAAYGVWTWVSRDMRMAMLEVLARLLKPGGAFVVGYNAAPAWIELSPVRHIFQRVLARTDGPKAVTAAKAAVDHWISVPGKESAVARKWEDLKRYGDTYLLHEFGSRHGTGIWFEDLEADLATAKLSYAGPVDLADQFSSFYLSKTQQAFLRDEAVEGWQEAARDLVTKRMFREDVFVRGAPSLTLSEVEDVLSSHWSICIWEPFLEYERKRAGTSRGIEARMEACIREALGGEAIPAGRFLAALPVDGIKALQATFVSMAIRLTAIVRTDAAAAGATDAVTQFNRTVARRWMSGVPLAGVASARLGGGFSLSAEEQKALRGGGASESREISQGLERLKTGIWQPEKTYVQDP